MPGSAPGAAVGEPEADPVWLAAEDEVVDGAALPPVDAGGEAEVEPRDADPLVHPPSPSTPAATTARTAAGFGRRFTADTVSGRPMRRLANRPGQGG
jgi:hypothetical protein